MWALLVLNLKGQYKYANFQVVINYEDYYIRQNSHAACSNMYVINDYPPLSPSLSLPLSLSSPLLSSLLYNSQSSVFVISML